MITKLKEKGRAVYLRRRGFSYSEILKEVSVAKSTLSLWLKSVGLSKRQKQRLTEKKLAAMKRGWETVHRLRMERWNEIKTQASQEIKKLSKKERWLLGTSLYWAEGAKEKEHSGATGIKFSNSDVFMILIFRQWLKEFFGLASESIKYELYIHDGANWKAARNFWASKLNISINKIRIYFKPRNPKPRRKNLGKEYNGLIRISVNGSIPLVRKISGWIEGIYRNWGAM